MVLTSHRKYATFEGVDTDHDSDGRSFDPVIFPRHLFQNYNWLSNQISGGNSLVSRLMNTSPCWIEDDKACGNGTSW